MKTAYFAKIRDLNARGIGYEEYRRAYSSNGELLGFLADLGIITADHWPRDRIRAADRHCCVKVEADFPAGTIILATYLGLGGACRRAPDVGVILAEPVDGKIIEWNGSHTLVGSQRRDEKWVTVIERAGERLELRG